jgi:radical SAM-linked protein
MSHETPVQQRLRITFGKSGTLKYTSSLDVSKIWERVLRRANLPILYTKGFNTRPRIQLAMPLPLGITSECEIIDVALRESIELDEKKLIALLIDVSPQGLDINKIENVTIHESAMQSLVLSAEYRLRFEDGIDKDFLQRKVDDILNQDTIVVDKIKKRRRSVIDLRPLIIDLAVDDNNDLIAHLSVGDRGNMRPDQLIEQMGFSDQYISVHRYKLHALKP